MNSDGQLIWEAYEGAEWVDIDNLIDKTQPWSERNSIPRVGSFDRQTLKVSPGEGHEQIGTGERVTYTASVPNPDHANDPLNTHLTFVIRGVVSKITSQSIHVHVVEVREAPTMPRGADWETGIEGN